MSQTGGATFNYKASSAIYDALTPPTSVINDPPKPDLPCPRCRKTFTTKRGRDIHILGVHLGTRFSCPIEGCPSNFAQYSSLIRHVVGERDPNGKNSGKHMDIIEEYKLNETFFTNATGMVVCSEHGYLEFTPDREFANHVMNEHLNIRLPCPVCKNWATSRMPALIEHVYQEHTPSMQ